MCYEKHIIQKHCTAKKKNIRKLLGLVCIYYSSLLGYENTNNKWK